MSASAAGPGRDPPDASVVATLERVELAAREQRLTAQAEAAGILAAAAEAAAAIETDGPTRVAAALADLRARHLGRAADEIAEIEAAGTAMAAIYPSDRDSRPAAITMAVEQVVAAVLAEPGE
jgi:hypothetical protein